MQKNANDGPQLEYGRATGAERFRPPAPVPRAESLGVVALIRTLRDNPLEAWTRAHFAQPIVIARLPFGQVAAVNDPGAIRRVLLDNAPNYRKDTLQRRIVSAAFNHGLLMAEAEQWRFQRRTLAPLFTARAVAGFAPVMAQAAAALVGRWQRCVGQTIDVADEVTRLTLDVLRQTIFSDGLGRDGRDTEDFREAMRTYFDTIGQIDPFDILNMPEVIPRLTRWKARPTLRFFESAVDEIIARRRRRLAREPKRVERDILTLLLEARDGETGQGLSETEIKANIITFIAAGHETTANTLAWSLFLLSQSPEWRERVAAEAAREWGGPRENLAARLVDARAVVEEALRLYPPLAGISRQALAPDELAGHAIPAGTTVVIAPYVLHRSPRLWDAPDLFDPTRFLGSARAAIDRYAYLPFGAGPRICMGASFALQEATLTLAAIMRNFRLTLAPGFDVWPLQRVTLRPRGGLPMHISSRREGRSVAEPQRASRVQHPQPAAEP